VPLVFGICGGLALFSVLLLTMRRTTRAYLARPDASVSA
jgi:hypothetical protein